MLHPIDTTGYNKPKAWCGPSAVSTLTGMPLVRATEILTRIAGCTYEELEGVWQEETILALYEAGYRCEPLDIAGRYPETTHGPTLDRFLRDRRVDEVVTPLLIEISGHFVCSHFSYCNDNWTLRPREIKAFPKMKRLVKRAWKVSKIK